MGTNKRRIKDDWRVGMSWSVTYILSQVLTVVERYSQALDLLVA